MRTCSGKPPDLRRGPETLPEPFGKAAFGQYSEQEADRSPQHHLDAKCSNTEAPQNYGRELFWHFIDLRQRILDDRDDDEECRTGDERRNPPRGAVQVPLRERVQPPKSRASQRIVPFEARSSQDFRPKADLPDI